MRLQVSPDPGWGGGEDGFIGRHFFLVNLQLCLNVGLIATFSNYKGGYTFVTLPRIVTPYRDSVDGTRDRVTYQKLVTR